MLVILGGTFDPIHLGHIHAGTHVSTTLNQPTTLMIAPTPRLRGPTAAAFQDRWTMVQLACEHYSELLTSDFEVNLPVPTQTVRTLSHLKKRHNQLIYVMGTDAFNQIENWSETARLHSLTSIYLLQRPGAPLKPRPKSFQFTRSAENLTRKSGLIYVAEVEMLDISANQVRQAIQVRQNFKHLVPAAVYEYIITNNLYRKRD